MPTINWGTSSLAFSGGQRVYVRQRWADAWTYQGNIWCSEVTWSLLPAIPVAQLSLEYGYVLPHGSQVWVTQSKLNLAGWWIKIEVDVADGTVSWYGFIDESADEQGGITGGVASGIQRWVAYGPTQVLAHAFQTRSRWYDEMGGVPRWSGSAIAFNADGRPNRTGSIPPEEAGHMFAPRAPENQYVSPFSPAEYWSTRDILEYLQNHGQPLGTGDEAFVPFAFDNLEDAPDWDQPVVETEGRSTLDIINQLINPGRLMQVSVGVSPFVGPPPADPDRILLTIHSLVASATDIGSGRTHPGNSDQLSLVTWAAQDTNIAVQDSLSRRAHQVTLKGAKRQSVMTLQVGENFGDVGNGKGLSECFTTMQRTDYDAAASNEADYGALSDDEKRLRNQIVRAKAELADVYRTFNVNPDWDFVISGEGVFPPDDTAVGAVQHWPWWNAIRVMPQLPLKETFDYEQTTLVSGPSPKLTFEDDHLTQDRRPYVLFERPGEGRYLDATKMSNGSDPKFSCYVGVGKDGQAAELDVTGAYQHAIAYGRFVPLAADNDANGEWTYFDAYFTLALEEDRFVESFQPSTSDLTGLDVIRRRLIYAGGAYQQINVAAQTVFDVDGEGHHLLVAKGQSVPQFRDDRDELVSLAELAYRWHTVPRKILRLVSSRPSSVAAVGQFVTTVNAGTPHADTINSIVTEISISMPRGVDLPNQTAQFSLVTAVGELDPLAFAPALTKVI